MNNIVRILVVFSLLLLMSSCEKEIDVDLPRPEEKLIVEGIIETDQFPYVVLSKSTGYFDPTDAQSVANSYVSDAVISISDGTVTNQMSKICSSSLSAAQQKELSDLLGIPVALLSSYDICGFVDLSMVGEVGKSYTISIDWKGNNYQGTTQLVEPVSLDSSWFEVFGDRDSLGFLYAEMSEPAAEKNFYRWFAQRINSYQYGSLKGQQKDESFLLPSSSVFDDEFVNGTTFEFGYGRPVASDKFDDQVPERGFYKVGDTVVVKFCSIDKGVFSFISTAEEQILSTGSPFATPVNVPSNISNGALGLWAGYSPYFDTIICL